MPSKNTKPQAAAEAPAPEAGPALAPLASSPVVTADVAPQPKPRRARAQAPAPVSPALVAAPTAGPVVELPAVSETTPELAPKLGKGKGQKKPKLVRDSFTFPEAEYALLAQLKRRLLGAGHEVKKSELLRAGLASLAALSDADLVQALAQLEKLKTGRPSKG